MAQPDILKIIENSKADEIMMGMLDPEVMLQANAESEMFAADMFAVPQKTAPEPQQPEEPKTEETYISPKNMTKEDLLTAMAALGMDPSCDSPSPVEPELFPAMPLSAPAKKGALSEIHSNLSSTQKSNHNGIPLKARHPAAKPLSMAELSKKFGFDPKAHHTLREDSPPIVKHCSQHVSIVEEFSTESHSPSLRTAIWYGPAFDFINPQFDDLKQQPTTVTPPAQKP